MINCLGKGGQLAGVLHCITWGRLEPWLPGIHRLPPARADGCRYALIVKEGIRFLGAPYYSWSPERGVGAFITRRATFPTKPETATVVSKC